MKINLSVRINDQFYTGGADMEVPDILEQAFEPLRKTDEPFLAAVLGESTMVEAQIVLRFRKNAAKELSEAIAGLILEEMQKNDTLNGYPLKRLEE